MDGSVVDSTPFEHRPLDTNKQQIRLIKLQPGYEAVLCDIDIFDLESHPPFIALSYAWGELSFTHTIYMNSKMFGIRTNLLNFLKVFRNDEANFTWLWVDQLCINQHDVEEKNHQVKLMSNIFREAKSVVAWLGKSAKDVEAAEQYTSSGDLEQLRVLLLNPYFTRLWIVQEILLAREVHLLCGKIWIAYAEMAETVETCSWQQYPNVALSLFSEGAADYARNGISVLHHPLEISAEQTSLEVCVKRYSSNVCADPRDKVYGLLGLVGGREMEADYGKSIHDVFLDAIRTMFLQKKNQVQYDEEMDEQFFFKRVCLELGRNMGISGDQLYGLRSMIDDIWECTVSRDPISVTHPQDQLLVSPGIGNMKLGFEAATGQGVTNQMLNTARQFEHHNDSSVQTTITPDRWYIYYPGTTTPRYYYNCATTR